MPEAAEGMAPAQVTKEEQIIRMCQMGALEAFEEKRDADRRKMYAVIFSGLTRTRKSG